MANRRPVIELPLEDREEIEREQSVAPADTTARREAFARADAQRARLKREGYDFDGEPLNKSSNKR